MLQLFYHQRFFNKGGVFQHELIECVDRLEERILNYHICESGGDFGWGELAGGKKTREAHIEKGPLFGKGNKPLNIFWQVLEGDHIILRRIQFEMLRERNGSDAPFFIIRFVHVHLEIFGGILGKRTLSDDGLYQLYIDL